MPAKSKAQQRAFGAALSVYEGEQKLSDLQGAGFRGMVKKLVSQQRQGRVDLRAFAETPTRGLPERKR